jgi:hypothetical protein
MKKYFYLGIIGLALFEVANVYFIMPMPGSQRMESLDLAYFLYQWRWGFRAVFGAGVVAGLLPALQASNGLALLALAALAVVAYQFNVEMAAEKMFLKPRILRMADVPSNKVHLDKLVLGIERNGQAKAYPIQFLGYHHQVLDTVGGEPIMVTYCTVCRTGRVFSPTVNGRPEQFRLVGMDHFNAMFEDATTKSWWRQVSGEAVTGPLKGTQLPELPVTQTSLRAWLKLFPGSLVMQADSAFSEEYADLDTYDVGLKRGKLTTTDTLSWKDKSWVVGIELDPKTAKAYDWNRLKTERIIQDTVGEQPVLLVLADDGKGFFAFERPNAESVFSLKNDTLFQGEKKWNLLGIASSPADGNLRKINAYQEFWHSWRTFHPHTTRY